MAAGGGRADAGDLVVGGATRLTGSGLSIVEWRPVTGVVPPLDQAAWQAEFAKYQTIPQYRELNRGMSLDEFKTIYWWEWSHRMLARLVGAAFLLPFLWFLWRGELERHLQLRLWTIFGLGAALGAVGWWMVSSGLADRVRVSQYRLGFHLTLACFIYALVLWTAQRLVPRDPLVVPARIRASAVGLIVLVLMQIYLGALVAGLHAGLISDTWPLIDGKHRARCVTAVLPHPVVAEFLRESAHRAVRSSHAGLRAPHLCPAARRRCGADGGGRGRAGRRARARDCAHPAGRVGGPGPRLSRAARARAHAPGDGDAWRSRSRSCMRSAWSGRPSCCHRLQRGGRRNRRNERHDRGVLHG